MEAEEEINTKSEMNGNSMDDVENKAKLPHLIKDEAIDPNDIVDYELDTINPWSVEDVSVFLKYNCPECEFADLDLKMFVDHALENHKRSNVLFANSFSVGPISSQKMNGESVHVDENVQEIKPGVFDNNEDYNEDYNNENYDNYDYNDPDYQYFEEEVKPKESHWNQENAKPKKRRKRKKKADGNALK